MKLGKGSSNKVAKGSADPESPTMKSCLAALSSSKAKFAKAHQGYRQEQRIMLQTCQIWITWLSEKESRPKKFVRLLGNEAKGSGKINLALEVVVAASGSSRKLSSKYARILTYLRSEGVKDVSTANAIESKGGIEKCYQQSISKVGRGQSEAKRAAKSERKVRDAPQAAIRNDQFMSINVRISLSDHGYLHDLDAGNAVEAVVAKTAQNELQLHVRSRQATVDDEDIWAEEAA